jgi:hypothetical protein
MPDEIEAEPGSSEGADASDETSGEAGQREQGVRTEESRDLSSPRFTVHENDHEAT